jgi:hypothetical protein
MRTFASPSAAYRLHESQRHLKLFFRNGRIALSIGLGFLIVCIVLREFVFASGHGAVAEIASEGSTHSRLGSNVAPIGDFSL